MSSYRPPRPPVSTPDMMGDPLQDRASIRNPEIYTKLAELMRDARMLFGANAQLTAILNELDGIIEHEELSMRGFCTMIGRMERAEIPSLGERERYHMEQFLEHARREIRGALERFRDPQLPLTPHEFVRLNSKEYPGSPWYVGGFQYLDPHSGTTGSSQVPHLVFVRTPQFVDLPDATFNGEYFLHSRHLERQVNDDRPFLVRTHSECFLGETCSHDRCDCELQLHHAMKTIEENQLGAVIYLRQEARGAGLFDKLRFFGLVDGRNRGGKWIGRGKYDTSTSMTVLGHRDDTREFGFAVRALRGVGIHPQTTPITMITNNPKKLEPFQNAGFQVSHQPGALESVQSAEAVSEIILLKIIHQRHTVPWQQLQAYLEPQLQQIADGQLAKVDIRIRFALLQLGHHMHAGNAHNCPLELRTWVEQLWQQLLLDPENGHPSGNET